MMAKCDDDDDDDDDDNDEDNDDDGNDDNAEAGGYVHLGRVFWQEEDNNEDGDEQHKEDVATRSKFETLCMGEPLLLSLPTTRPKR